MQVVRKSTKTGLDQVTKAVKIQITFLSRCLIDVILIEHQEM